MTSPRMAAVSAAFADPDVRRMRGDTQRARENRVRAETVHTVRRLVDEALARHGADRDAAVEQITAALATEIASTDRTPAVAVIGELLPAYVAERARSAAGH